MSVGRGAWAIVAPIVVATLSVLGCRPSSPTFAEGYLCPEPERRCPDDQICVSGVCQRPSEIDAGDPDSGTQPPAVCGSPSQFGADFETMPFWLGSFTNDEGTGGTAIAVDQTLELAVPATPFAFVSANSKFALDLTGSRISVETGSVTGDLEVGLSLIADDEGGVIMFRDPAGALSAQLIASDGSVLSTVLASIALDKVWFSFSEVNGELHFQVSSDHATWETIRSVPTPSWIAVGSPRFEAFSPTGVGGIVRFDNVNGRAAAGGACPATDLAERFEDAEFTVGVRTFEEQCTAVVENGVLTIAHEAGGEGVCAVFSIYFANLEESETSIEIVQPASAPSEFTAGLEYESDGGFLLIAVGETTLRASVCSRVGNCTTLGTQPFDAAAHRFWKIRETGGEVIYELSADATNWNEFAKITTPWPLTAGRANFFTINSSAEMNTFRLDNFNAN